MINTRLNARVTGVLFILGTLPGIAAMALSGGLLAAPDCLAILAAHRLSVLVSALLVLLMGFACAGIGLSLYPVLRRHGEGLALAAAGFRVMEGTLHVVNAFGFVALLALSQEFVAAGSPAGSFYQPAGAVIQTLRDWAANGTAVFPWCIAAFIYYGVFYRTRLVPRWLSVWGLVSLVLFLASAFAVMFGLLKSLSPLQGLLAMPIAVQEMVLAAWLIIKGYRR